jgi:Na+/proline symporter
LIVQRVLACKNVADGRKALILSTVMMFPLFLIFLLVGALLWVFYQAHEIPIKGQPNDYIYPIFMMTSVPHVLKGSLIVAILAAAMSSVSSALTSLASVSTMDFVKGLMRSARSEEFHLRFSKYSTLFWAGALILVAYLSRRVDYVFNAAFSLRGLTSGALLGGLLLVLFWRKGKPLPVFVGMIGSFLAMILISRLEWADSTGARFKIAWPWYTLIGTSITMGSAWTTRLLWTANRKLTESK